MQVFFIYWFIWLVFHALLKNIFLHDAKKHYDREKPWTIHKLLIELTTGGSERKPAFEHVM